MKHARPLALFALCLAPFGAPAAGLAPEELAAVRAAEAERVRLIERVHPSVVILLPRSREGSGSGVIIDPDGLTLTNAHVMDQLGETGSATLPDGRVFPVRLLGYDWQGDLALARIEAPSALPAARLGDSTAARVGDWVMAIGNPFQLALDFQPSVTLGVISGIERYQKGTTRPPRINGHCLQFDAPVNPGNSGGPLFDARGEVIGINSRIAGGERGKINVGIGFAVASEQVKNFLGDLRAARTCQHGTLDAVFSDRDGAVVCDRVGERAPLARLGLAPGDRLIEFDGYAVRDANYLASLLTIYPAHWPVRVTFAHEDKPRTVIARLLPPALPPGALAGFLPQVAALGIRDRNRNFRELEGTLNRWRTRMGTAPSGGWIWRERVDETNRTAWTQDVRLATDGRYRVARADGTACGWNGTAFWSRMAGGASSTNAPDSLPASADLRPLRLLLNLWLKHDGLTRDSACLEGGDKTQGIRADRVRLPGPEGRDWLLWFALFNEEGTLTGPILKASESPNSADESPAWTLSDYRRVGEALLPHRRRLVEGLAENALLDVQLVECTTVTNWPGSAFEPSAGH